MKKGLQNIKAIKQMIAGTHRTQNTKNISYLQQTKGDDLRKVGETWTDESGDTWIQREGYRMKKDKLDEILAYLSSCKMPTECPKCKNLMTKRLDKKFWILERHCFDCQVAFEHELRITGKYKEYEKSKVTKNVESWLSQAEKEVKELANVFRDPVSFVNIDGVDENWISNQQNVADKIETDFQTLKDKLLQC